MEDNFDFGGVISLLRRRAVLIIFVTTAVLIAATVAAVTLKPVYTATALVLIDPTKKNLLDASTQVTSSSSDSARVDGEVELVDSDMVLLHVIDKLELISDDEFGLSVATKDKLLAMVGVPLPAPPQGDDAINRVVERLASLVSVSRRGLTYLIAVDARSRSAKRAAEIANAVARSYIQEQLLAKTTSILTSRDAIVAQVVESSKLLAEREGAIDTYIDDSIDRIATETGRTDLDQTRTDLLRLQDERTRKGILIESAQASLERKDWNALSVSLNDDILQQLSDQREQVLGDIAGSLDKSGTSTGLEARLAKIEADLAARAAVQLSDVRQGLAADQANYSDLRTHLRDAVATGGVPADILSRVYELQQAAIVARTQYETLVGRQQDLSTQAALQLPDARVVSEATPPIAPSSPNTRLLLILGGVLGLAAGIGLAVLLENVVGGFSSEEQAQGVLKIGSVSVPRLRGGRRESLTSVADAMVVMPLSEYAESIRRVRINIDNALRPRRAKIGPSGHKASVIVVTSTISGEGKSTTALSLARTFALSGAATLLVDGDLRDPNLHRYLGAKPSSGLLEYLSGTEQVADLSAIITVDAASGAKVIMGARRSDVATDQLVGGETFARLVSAARNNFEIVIIDTPPVGPIVDALYLAGMADVIVYVVKWASTAQRRVKRALRALTESKAADDVKIIAVLNQSKSEGAEAARYSGYSRAGRREPRTPVTSN